MPIFVEAPTALRDRAEAEAYVALVCFKHGPPNLLGVELEWIVQHADDPCRHLDAEVLAAALGRYAPTTLNPDSPHDDLPAGSTLTVEPGGQVEISTPPRQGLEALLATASADAVTVAELLAPAGLTTLGAGADPHRSPRRLLRAPRYVALEAHLDRIGHAGRTMMASTAALQVSVDTGPDHRRWRALHVLGPPLLAAFANSGRVRGVRTGWASSRMAAWFGIAPPPDRAWYDTANPAETYAGWALDHHLVCVRRDNGDWCSPPGVSFADWVAGRPGAPSRPPTTADLDYHLSTLFPPVRPRGHLEVRYLDAQPSKRWAVPVAVLHTLLADAATTEAAVAIAEPTEGRWLDAARCGTGDPALHAAAGALLALAAERFDGPAWLADLMGELVREGERT